MEKPTNQRAWWFVTPVVIVVAFSAIIPLMTVVNYSVQDILGPSQRVFVGREWYHKVLTDPELHGAMIPTGERRRYPHLMTLEAVAGMEKRTPSVTNDLTIPFTRNVMGPVSFTVIRFSKSLGSHAYQMATPIVYEAGLMIYAEHGDTLLRMGLWWRQFEEQLRSMQ